MDQRIRSEPIWRRVQECARELTRKGKVPFTRTDLINCIKQVDPKCEANSINPIIQGVTDNLKGGAPGAEGRQILFSVGRGQFVLYSKKNEWRNANPTSAKPKSARPNEISHVSPMTDVPGTENELRDIILAKLRTLVGTEDDIALVPEGRLSYSLPDGHTLYHASDILASAPDRSRFVSIELKYRSAVTDQFKCRAYDAMHMKKEYGERLLNVMLFVKSTAGVSIAQARRISHIFDRFIGVPIDELHDSTHWESLSRDIKSFLA